VVLKKGTATKKKTKFDYIINIFMGEMNAFGMFGDVLGVPQVEQHPS
jgi:hypothetical protein